MTLKICSSAPNAERQITVAERAQLVDARLIERDILADDALRAVRRRAASAHAQQFSWEHTADQLLESYSRALRSFTASVGSGERGHRRWRRRRLSRAGV